jgi:hypothetical protein
VILTVIGLGMRSTENAIIMKLFNCALFVFAICSLFNTNDAFGQHCPPIVESYLSGTTVKRSGKGIEFQFAYTKTGGQTKEAFQAYVLAYADASADEVEKLTPQKAIEQGLAKVIHTQLTKREESGTYNITCNLVTEDFTAKMLEAKLIDKSRATNTGGWKSFDDDLRLAVFIPFLDDEKYSALEGLPEDTHECNYRGDAALLFQPTTQKLSIRFGVVQATKLDDGIHYIELNGQRPAGDNAR